MKSLLFRLLTISIFLLWSQVPAFATGDFSVSFQSTYDVDTNSLTTTTHQIKLTNKRPNIFAADYSITIGSTNIASIHSFDDISWLPVTVSNLDNKTQITVNLESRPVIGTGQTKIFTIQYQNQDIATNVGNVLEINIPKIANANEFNQNQLTLIVPETFGELSNIFPDATYITRSNHKHIIKFDNQFDSSVSAVFGNTQTFKVNLSYYLTNSSLRSTQAKIALIPDTSYQRATYLSLVPPPPSLRRDEDGNWIASYPLEPATDLKVTADVLVEISMAPIVEIPSADPMPYLKSDSYWPSDDPEIINLAQRLKTPSAIYDFVVDSLEYDFSRVLNNPARLGAKKALENPNQAICMEFTDLFITLARAAGIPARELNGFAYTLNPKLRPLSLSQDVLHAWPEYWDDKAKRWIAIDPTWGKTTGGIDYFNKLDLNHIVFAIHGSSSSDPLPAGFYKTSADQGKTVVAQPVKLIPESEDLINVDFKMSRLIPTYKYSDTSITVTNSGPQARYAIPFSLVSGFSLRGPSIGSIAALLPGQKIELPVSIKPKDLLRSRIDDIRVTIDKVAYDYQIQSNPTAAIASFIIIFIAVGLIVFWIITQRSRRVHI